MISLFNNIKKGLERANIFKNILSLFFFTISYILIPETRLFVFEGFFYVYFPEILKSIKFKLLKSDNHRTILSYKSIFLEYTCKLIEYAFYSGLIDCYNKIYYFVPNNISLFMYIWKGFIDMQRYRYYCEVVIGTLIITACILTYPFLKVYYKKCEIIINNLTSIPLITYRNVFNAITEGQSLHINIDNITIMSIPAGYKENISEEELENIAPKKMPIKESIIEQDNMLEKKNCAICLEVIHVSKDMSRILPKCAHCFHCNCIDNWFFSGHRTCPICRERIF